MIRIFSLFAALSIAGCTTAPIVDAPVRADGQAMIGQATRAGPVVVTPQVLVEDSRCPMNARCVWAGRVVLRTQIDGSGWRETRNLVLGEPQAVRGARLALTSARPDKQAGVDVPASDYLFGFEAARR